MNSTPKNQGDKRSDDSCSDPYGLFSPDSDIIGKNTNKIKKRFDSNSEYDASGSDEEDSIESYSTAHDKSALETEDIKITENFLTNDSYNLWKFDNIPYNCGIRNKGNNSSFDSDTSTDSFTSCSFSKQNHSEVGFGMPNLSEEVNSVYDSSTDHDEKHRTENKNSDNGLHENFKKRGNRSVEPLHISHKRRRKHYIMKDKEADDDSKYEGDISESLSNLKAIDNLEEYTESLTPSRLEVDSEMIQFTKNTISPLNIKESKEEIVRIREEDLKDVNKTHLDKIGCYNIQNRYSHITAMEMFLREGFTFLSLQEPRGAQYKSSNSWISKTIMDLGKSRIKCFDSKFQIILTDNIAWGGKEEEDMKEWMSGRIVSVSYRFGSDDKGKIQRLGIVSVYGVSGEGKSKSGMLKKNIRSLLTACVKKIMKSWVDKFPGICIMILGDLQETISIKDKDNFGKYRRDYMDDGLINLLLPSHFSVVRDQNPDTKYWTRFGRDSHRGIDHILFPRDSKFKSWLYKHSNLDKVTGDNFFVSDHALISCKFIRLGRNNTNDDEIRTRFCYSKISKIPIIQSKDEEGKVTIGFDDSKFACKSSLDNGKMFEDIQKLTNEKSNYSIFKLGSIQLKIDKLWDKFCADSINQNIDGEKNKLTEIDENYASEMDDLTLEFMLAVEEIMKKLALDKEQSLTRKAKENRSNTIKGKWNNFFDSLPIAIEMVHLNDRVKWKATQLKRLKNTISWLKKGKANNQIEDIWDTVGFNFHKKLSLIIESTSIDANAKEIHGLLNEEEDQWKQHITSIFNKNNERKNGKENSPKARFLFQLSKNNLGRKYESLKLNKTLNNKVNKLMIDAECLHIFRDAPEDSDPYKFLSDDFFDWNEELIEVKERRIWNLQDQSNEVLDDIDSRLEKSVEKLENMSKKLFRAQSTYRQCKLLYLIQVCDLKTFAMKVRPQGRDAPAVHNSIFDKELGDIRNCRDEEEQLKATFEHHSRWMAKSDANESCFFAELIRVGKLGIRGVKLKPDRIFKRSDVKEVVKNGRYISKELRSAVISAHGKHTANLFRAPDKDKPEMFYPFYIKDWETTMTNGDLIEKKFWPALKKIPGKARHQGFHMAVIGRFQVCWQKCLLSIINLIFLLRYMPNCLKSIERYPIPKPGKPNETRPISLCNDIYCFVCDIMADLMSKAMEKAKVLHEGLSAYRPGMGCQMLVGTELGFREDCMEGGQPTCQLDEDEERFFDMIAPEVTLSAHRVNGFPVQGWLELKASCLSEKDVEIITNKGVIKAKFICGLEQGNPDSPRCANLVIKFKHDIWQCILKECLDDSVGKEFAYYFYSYDARDGKIKLYRIGYSDDNTRIISLVSDEELIKAVKQFIKQSGDLSIVLKIGRKGSKCDISFYNLKLKTIASLPQFDSIAWNYNKDGPIKENMPVRCHANENTLANLDKAGLSKEEIKKVESLTKLKNGKHLGLTSKLDGDTSTSYLKQLSKVRDRVKEIKISMMKEAPQKYSVNSLIVPMISFAPLQFNYDLNDLTKCDNFILDHIGKNKGFAKNDARHSLYLSNKKLGHEIKSLVDADIEANVRELEVILNGSMLDAFVARGRVDAMRNNEISNISSNFVREAIHKLAKLGIHVRDTDDGLTNYMVRKLEIHGRGFSVGCEEFDAGNHHSMKDGMEILTELSFDGSCFKKAERIVRQFRCNEKAREQDERLNERKIAKWWEDCILERKMDMVGSFWFFEWTYNPYLVSFMDSKATWSPHFCFRKVDNNIFERNDNMTTRECWDLVKDEIMINTKVLEGKNRTYRISSNIEYSFVLEMIRNSQSPIIIATDGGHNKVETCENTTGFKTTAAIVVCILDIKENETIESREWEGRPTIPLIARNMILPDQIGAGNSDIGHGEAVAYCMQEEIMDPAIPRCVVMDSTSVRNRVLELRDFEELSDRHYIREMMNGLGKTVLSRLENSIKRWAHIDVEEEATDPFHQELKIRNSKFIKIAATWVGGSAKAPDTDIREDTEKVKSWDQHYFDDNVHRCVLKVDSHQLDSHDGINQANPPRYRKIIPNIALTNANHHADKAAEEIMKVKLSEIKDFNSGVPYKLILPHSNLKFFLTWNNKSIDKNTIRFVRKKLELERLKRWKKKEVQGLLPRIIETSDADPELVNASRGWKRALLGKTNTHTRCMYMNTAIRIGWIMEEKCINTEHTVEQVEESFLNTKYIKNDPSLLHCRLCLKQTTMPENLKSSLGKNLKGNRRHLDFFCGNVFIAGFRKGMNILIEENLWLILDNFGSKDDQFNFIASINECLLSLRDSHEGRLETNDICINNYLHMNQWLNFFEAKQITDCRNTNKFILLHIFGFGTALGDGELEVKNLGIVDCMHMGIIPRAFNDMISKYIRMACNKLMNKEARVGLEKTLEGIWSDARELVKGKFIGLHRIVGGISKEVEKTFKRKYNLDIKKLRLRREELKNLKKESNSGNKKPQSDTCTNTRNEQNKITEMWARPLLCQGITCGNEKNFWNVMDGHNPYWIANNQVACERCGRAKTAIRKCLAFCKGIDMDDTIHLGLLTLFNTTFPKIQDLGKGEWPRLYRKFRKAGGYKGRILESRNNKVAINDRHAILLIAKVFGVVGANGWNKARRFLWYDFTISKLEEETDGNKGETIKSQEFTDPFKHNNEADGFETPEDEEITGELISFAAKRGIVLMEDLLSTGGQIGNKENEMVNKPNAGIQENASLHQRFTSRMMRNLGLGQIQGYTANEAATLIKVNGQPLSCIIMEIAILKMRRYTNKRTYIACSNVIERITLESGHQRNWKRIANVFESNFAKEKMDGVYFLPIFSGSHLRCGWSLILIHKRRKRISGWYFYFAGTTGESISSKLRRNVEEIFGSEGKIIWTTSNMQRNGRAEDGVFTILGGLMACWRSLDEENPGKWVDKLNLGTGKFRERKIVKIRNICSKLLLNNKSWWHDMNSLDSKTVIEAKSDIPGSPKRKRTRQKESENVRKAKRRA